MKELCITIPPFKPRGSGPLIPHNLLSGSHLINLHSKPLNLFCLLMQTIKILQKLQSLLFLLQHSVHIPKYTPIPTLEAHLTSLQSIHDTVPQTPIIWALSPLHYLLATFLPHPHGFKLKTFLYRFPRENIF